MDVERIGVVEKGVGKTGAKLPIAEICASDNTRGVV